MQRAHPPQAARPPPHGLGPGEIADRRLEHLGHDVGGGAAGLGDGGVPDLALLVVAGLQLVAGQAGGAQEPLQRGIGGVDAGALAVLMRGGAGGGQALDCQGQAARRAEGTGAGIGQAGLNQAIGHQALEVLARAGLHAGGNFLREKLDQQVGHQSITPRSGVLSLYWCQP